MPGSRTRAVVAACFEMIDRMCSVERYGEEAEGGSIVTRADGSRLWWAICERAAYYTCQWVHRV